MFQKKKRSQFCISDWQASKSQGFRILQQSTRRSRAVTHTSGGSGIRTQAVPTHGPLPHLLWLSRLTQ